jgi:hypothetical protein
MIRWKFIKKSEFSSTFYGGLIDFVFFFTTLECCDNYLKIQNSYMKKKTIHSCPSHSKYKRPDTF